MAFRFNLLFTWLGGWVVAAAFSLLIVVSLTGIRRSGIAHDIAPVVALIVMALVPTCFCWYAGLRNRRSLISIILLATSGWVFGGMFGSSVAISYNIWLGRIADLPLAGNEWMIKCLFLSGLFASCGVALAPNAKLSSAGEPNLE